MTRNEKVQNKFNLGLNSPNNNDNVKILSTVVSQDNYKQIIYLPNC